MAGTRQSLPQPSWTCAVYDDVLDPPLVAVELQVGWYDDFGRGDVGSENDAAILRDEGVEPTTVPCGTRSRLRADVLLGLLGVCKRVEYPGRRPGATTCSRGGCRARRKEVYG
jgi:hypothetical protein